MVEIERNIWKESSGGNIYENNKERGKSKKKGRGRGGNKDKIVITLVSPRKKGEGIYFTPPTPSPSCIPPSSFFESLRNLRGYFHRDGVDSVKLEKGIRELANTGAFPPMTYFHGMGHDEESLKVCK